MQTGQVSVWVPIIVGVLGLVGIVAAQFVNAWREDRRWKREQEREDVRWQRELDKHSIERRTADLAHWRDKKFETYSALLKYMKTWSLFLFETVRDWHDKESSLPEEVKATCHQYFEDSYDYRNEVELIATDRAALKTLIEAIEVYSDWMIPLSIGKSPIRSRETHIDDLIDSNHEVIGIVIAAIRVDLGIAADDERDYLSKVNQLKR